MRLGDKRNISISGQSLKWFSFARAIPTISTVPRIYNSKYPLLAGSSSSYSADNKSWPWLSPWPGRYQNPPLPELRILFSCHRVQLSRASHCGSVTAATIKSEISHTDEIFGLCRRSPSNISHFVSSSYCTLLLPIVYLEHRPGWWQDRLQPPGQVRAHARLARPSLYQRINIKHKDPKQSTSALEPSESREQAQRGPGHWPRCRHSNIFYAHLFSFYRTHWLPTGAAPSGRPPTYLV